jgi:hypothetical protein
MRALAPAVLVFCAVAAIASACVVENAAPTYAPLPPRRVVVVVDATAPVPGDAGIVDASPPAPVDAAAVLDSPTATD